MTCSVVLSFGLYLNVPKFNTQYIQPDVVLDQELLAPRVWHSYCFTYNQESRVRVVWLDGAAVLTDLADQKTPRQIEKDFFARGMFL